MTTGLGALKQGAIRLSPAALPSLLRPDMSYATQVSAVFRTRREEKCITHISVSGWSQGVLGLPTKKKPVYTQWPVASPNFGEPVAVVEARTRDPGHSVKLVEVGGGLRLVVTK